MNRVFFQPLAIFLALLISAVVMPAALAAYYARAYAGRVVPGVFLNGTNVGGMSAEEVFAVAQTQARFYQAPNIELNANGAIFDFKPAEVGSTYDIAATAQSAMQAGRAGDWFENAQTQAKLWWSGIDISPIVRMDEGAVVRAVSNIAKKMDRPAIDAKLAIDNGRVSEQASQTGVSIDQIASVKLIQVAIASRKNALIDLPFITTQPRVPTVASAAADASRILSNDVLVLRPTWDTNDQNSTPVEAFRLTPQQLQDYLLVDETTQNNAPSFSIRFKREKLRGLVEPFTKVVSQTAVNARFIFEDDKRVIVNLAPSKNARELDVESTLNAIETAARSDNRVVTMAMKIASPPVPQNATAAQLGVTQLITQATTFFKGSSAARLANVKVAASRFHGVVIPPGGTFSFNQYLGDVSKEEGFEEGLIIFGGRTIKGIGGGVCQVSTTAYQAALRAGFPVTERYPHGYRVSYYERGMGAGYDASVFTPYADLKFRNDTAAHLLIETHYDPARTTLTFKFYGTPDGRQVFISPSTITNVTPHGPDLYEKDTENELQGNAVKQVDFAVDGATISFTRIVKKGDATLINEKVVSKYIPWRNVFRYGPGFKPPDGAEVREQ